jgi:hypothetical protein
MINTLTTTAAIASMTVWATSAAAYVNTMYTSNDPATYGSLVQSLDVANTSYNFPVEPNRTNSGYLAEILDPGTGLPLSLNPAVNPNTTSIRSDVFEVNTTTTLTDPSGDLTLNPGDLVFSYTIRLVGASDNTVNSLREFSVSALGPLLGGVDIFDTSILKGRAFSLDGLPFATANAPEAAPGDLNLTGVPFISTLAWQWSDAVAQQLQNGEEVRLLMFSEPALITDGVGLLDGTPGQAVTGTDEGADNIPVLVPAIPSPGAAALFAIAGLAARRRRR